MRIPEHLFYSRRHEDDCSSGVTRTADVYSSVGIPTSMQVPSRFLSQIILSKSKKNQNKIDLTFYDQSKSVYSLDLK